MSAKTFKMNAQLLTGTALALVLASMAAPVLAQATTGVVAPAQTPYEAPASSETETAVDITITTPAPSVDVNVVDTAMPDAAATPDVVVVAPVAIAEPAAETVIIDAASANTVVVDPATDVEVVDPVAISAESVVVEDTGPANTMDASLALITRGDVIKRQAAISEDLLIMGREIALIDTVSGIVEKIGIDGLREIYPDLAKRIEGTPIALRAEIGRATLEGQLDTIALERAKMAAETSALVVPEEPVVGEQPQPNADGFMGMAVAPVGGVIDPEMQMQMQIAAQRAAERDAIMANLGVDTGDGETGDGAIEDTATAADTIGADDVKLVEVYGAAGDLRARIDVRGTVTTVRIGDTVSNLDIGAIGPDYIEVGAPDAPVLTRIRLNR